MATYLDIIAYSQATEDDEDKVSNENLELLHGILFGDIDFVMLTMDYRKTSKFDIAKARRCILHMFNNCSGVADIQTCCRVFLESLDDIASVAPVVAPMIKQLIAKYQYR
jgi:hypothetical protein